MSRGSSAGAGVPRATPERRTSSDTSRRQLSHSAVCASIAARCSGATSASTRSVTVFSPRHCMLADGKRYHAVVPLSEAFAQRAGVDPAAVEERLAAGLAEARTRWPAIALADDVYA